MAIIEDGLSVEVFRHDGVVLVGLSGELTAEAAPAFHAAVDAALVDGPHELQLGLSGVTFIDSGGLEALIVTRQRAGTFGVRMRIVGVSDQAGRVLAITGLDGGFDIVE